MTAAANAAYAAAAAAEHEWQDARMMALLEEQP